MFLKLAWRNIWRNKRRSLITIASIFFAIFFSVVMRTMQLGSYDLMIDSMVRFYSGYIQIHSNGYWDEQTLDNSFDFDEEFLKNIAKTKGTTLVVPRLESFALGSSGQLTKGAMVVGIDPEEEDQFMQLSEKLTEGVFFGKDDKSILLAEGLANYFGISVNDTLVLISQGYHGVSAAGKYHISGVLKFGSPQLNDNILFLPLKEAQWFYGAENRITSLVLLIRDRNEIQSVIDAIKQNLDDDKFEIMGWEEMMPDLVQMIQADSVGGRIMLAILYMIITFGIFGTVMMMTNERMYEFGVLISVGMRRWKIALILFIETLLISIIGIISGTIAVEPLVYYIHNNPIPLTGQAAEATKEFGMEALIQTSIDPTIVLAQAVIVIVISLCLSIYPAIVVSHLKPVNAMRK